MEQVRCYIYLSNLKLKSSYDDQKMWRHSWCQSECCVVLSLELRSSRQCLGSICRKCLPGPLSWRWDVAPVLCITWTLTQPRVTTSARVLKTTRLPCFNRSCCEIRVFHPYLMARSPRLTDSPWPRRWGWQRSDESFVTLRDSFLCPVWNAWLIIHLCSREGWAH